MNLYFAQNFKQFRRNADLTQEEIASALGVSPQAISRWETGATYPDIELLPIIAEYFSVSIERLLGVEQSRRIERKEQFKAIFQEAIKHGRIAECIDISRQAVREFPKAWELQNQLMYALFVSGSDDGNIPNWQENIEKYKQEIIDIGNHIIQHCTDDAIRLDAKSRLGFHYCEIGELDKGKQIFESLPTIDSCKEVMMDWALRGEESKQYNRELFSRFLRITVWRLWTIATESDGSAEEKIAQLLKFEQIVGIIYDANDLGDLNLALSRIYLHSFAPLALECGRMDDLFSYLEIGTKYMKKYAALPEKYVHTSYLVKGVCDHRYGDTADSRAPWEIIVQRDLCDPKYDRVREDARFQRVLRELSSISYLE